MSNYDIFISYRSTNKPWVETLARNLRSIGYPRVFLDFWELIPGQNFNQQIYEALQTIPRAILYLRRLPTIWRMRNKSINGYHKPQLHPLNRFSSIHCYGSYIGKICW